MYTDKIMKRLNGSHRYAPQRLLYLLVCIMYAIPVLSVSIQQRCTAPKARPTVQQQSAPDNGSHCH